MADLCAHDKYPCLTAPVAAELVGGGGKCIE